MLDTRQIHPMSDFVRNPKAHVARLKETRTPEVLTVNRRAEVVRLDTQTYEDLMERLSNIDKIAAIHAHMAEARKNAPPLEPITEEETERLGLYR